MSCLDCNLKSLATYSGGLSRYYCEHSDAPPGAGSLICKTKRGSTELTRKKPPKWCPLGGGKANEAINEQAR